MADTVVISSGDVDRLVYVAIAGARNDAETDLLAGLTNHLLRQQPTSTVTTLRNAIDELQAAIAAHRPARASDLAANSALLMSRLLTRAVPALTTPAVKRAARDYTRAFFRSHRAGTPLRRQVAPLELQFDRFGEVARFRRDIWRDLYDRAKARPAVAQALDTSPIAAALGVQTSQDALAMLQEVPLEPLRQFILLRGGALVVVRADLDAVMASAGSTMTALAASYQANLFRLNAAQQEDNVDGTGHPPPPDPDSEFVQAIRKAEENKKDIDDAFDKTAKGVKGTFDVLSAAAGLFNDDDLAKGIDDYGAILVKIVTSSKDFADAAIEIAKVIEKLDDITFDQVLLGASIGFNVAMVAVAIGLSGLLSQSKPPTQVILEQLKEIRKQIVDLRNEMRVRFDRLESRLNDMYAGLLDKLAEMDFDLGQIEGNVDELQVALYDLHADLARLATDVHAFLEAANRRDLIETINSVLGFRERTGEDLPLDDFRDGENRFFSWGHDHAKDVLQSGSEDRDFTDPQLLTEITAFPLATNINYLREFPAERLGLAPLSPARLANPFDWIVAGEAYAQLHEESPTRTPSAARIADLVAVGEALGASLSRIADAGLFTGLAQHYRSSFDDLQIAIGNVEKEFKVDPDVGLSGIDLWGGVNQVPLKHPLDGDWVKVGRCDGKTFEDGHDSLPLPASIRTFGYAALQPLMIASNLSLSTVAGVRDGLTTLRSCVAARWTVQDVGTAPGPNVRVTYRLSFSVDISYGSTLVFQHAYETAETLQLLVPKAQFENGTFDPAKGHDPHSLLVGTKNLWNKIDTLLATHGVVNAPLVAATAALVQTKLVLLQRAFYADVSRRFVRAGDAVQMSASVLNGWREVWRAFVIAGLPLRSEANEILHALLFGGDAILAGSDAGRANTLLDDVQDLYAFFSGRTEDPPAANIAGDITTLALARLARLSGLLDDIVREIKSAGEPEPPELFAPTLLRLRLLLPV